MPRTAPTTYTASGSFTITPSAGDAQVFIGVSPGYPCPGNTIALQGSNTTGAPFYDLGLFDSDFRGPVYGGVPLLKLPVGYYGRIANFNILQVVFVITLGSLVIETWTGPIS